MVYTYMKKESGNISVSGLTQKYHKCRRLYSALYFELRRTILLLNNTYKTLTYNNNNKYK